MFKPVYLKNFRKGFATNSSSTHSLIYKNKEDMFEDLNIFGVNYFDRFTENIAASREAKIKYVFHAIWWNDELVKLLSAFYPEMKEYYSLAKEAGEHDGYDKFGMYSRGSFSNKDVLFSAEYLRHIIDCEDIVIIGGSDEMDFVYDTKRGHQEVPTADDIDEWFSKTGEHNNNPIKNGNYYVAYGNRWVTNDAPNNRYDTEDSGTRFRYCTNGKVRFMVEDGTPTPEYPELIDLRITNRCDHGCPFCFMNSDNKQPDADIKELETFINNLQIKTEFSIGGGNVLLYPHLEKLFKSLKEHGHIVNTTINVKDCDRIMNDEALKQLFIEYVDGIGVSVFDRADVEKYEEFREALKHEDSYGRTVHKYTVMHIVPEYLGFEKTKEVLSAAGYNEVLLLGYKETGRGKKCKHTVFTKDQLRKLIGERHLNLLVDTQFAKTYAEFIDETFDTEYTLTPNEGEYSLYIDGITMNAYKSSYETDKPYFVGDEFDKPWDKRNKERYSLKKAFENVRKDCGFEVFTAKHYWDEA